jgi:uncharacterized UPF0146 family protein
MGDSKRGIEFSLFIKRSFPIDKYHNIADIAGGKKGVVAKELSKLGYKVTSFDVRKNKSLKKYDFKHKDVTKLKFKTKEYDLIVGMHPDEATWHIIRLAHESKTSFAVVPCCVHPPEKVNVSHKNWIKYLQQKADNFGFKTQIISLPIYGSKEVLVGKFS